MADQDVDFAARLKALRGPVQEPPISTAPTLQGQAGALATVAGEGSAQSTFVKLWTDYAATDARLETETRGKARVACVRYAPEAAR